MSKRAIYWLLSFCLLGLTGGCNRERGAFDVEVKPGAPLGFPLHSSRIAVRDDSAGLQIVNGWFVHEGRVVWGYAQYSGFWGGYRDKKGWWASYKVRTNITRREPGKASPSFTEDLDRLTDAMRKFGYPGFEHSFGLWFDRRRDAHDSIRRPDANVVSPFLEQPWARSTSGRAWDGLPKYDLERFNPWYFMRLKQFADLSDKKGTILLFTFYMQHALLETQAHYADFPWRPANAIQDTGMPDQIPAANVFYDVSHPVRRELHRLYIRKCLEELGRNSNVVFLLGQEFTGPLSFVQFWLDTIAEWEEEAGKIVLVGLGATKDCLDAILTDPERGPRVSVLDLRYWWYLSDGSLHAPLGGREVPGRYAFGATRTTPEQIYRQVREYRQAFPQRAILHAVNADQKQTWAFLMGGGSLLVRFLEYPDSPAPETWRPPLDYIAPEASRVVQPVYDWIQSHLANTLQRTQPAPQLVNNPQHNWCLADPNRTYLVYALQGGYIELDLRGASGPFNLYWINPSNGSLMPAGDGKVVGGGTVQLNTPDDRDWVLWAQAVTESIESSSAKRVSWYGTLPVGRTSPS